MSSYGDDHDGRDTRRSENTRSSENTRRSENTRPSGNPRRSENARLSEGTRPSENTRPSEDTRRSGTGPLNSDANDESSRRPSINQGRARGPAMRQGDAAPRPGQPSSQGQGRGNARGRGSGPGHREDVPRTRAGRQDHACLSGEDSGVHDLDNDFGGLRVRDDRH